MPVLFRAGSRTFAPSWLMTLLVLLACVAFIRLGEWQWHKGQLRQAEYDRFAQGSDRVQDLDATATSLAAITRFQRVRLTGHYDASHQYLLDNRTHEGRAGYEVLTPLQRTHGPLILIDRGWVPFTGRRDDLPSVALASNPAAPSGVSGDTVTLTGRVDELPAAGLASGRAAPPKEGAWPKVTSYPTPAELEAALGTPLEPRIVLLDKNLPNGYVRDWQPPGMPPLRHLSYAIQWWAFAVLAVVLWVIMSFKPAPAEPMRRSVEQGRGSPPKKDDQSGGQANGHNSEQATTHE